MDARILIIGNTDGIGLGTTRALLKRGDQVVGISRRQGDLEHARYRHVVADVGENRYVEVLRSVLGESGPFGACIFCAGIGETFDPEAIDLDRRVFEVNLMGFVRTAEVVVPAMIRAGGGHLVGLSSIADGLIIPGAVSYSASKAGLTSYLSGLALALRPHGVAVTNIRFGFVDTKMADSPVRPLMIRVDRAVALVLRCLQRRPAEFTYPWVAGAAAGVLRTWTRARIRWMRG
jgi:NAD(P)-dependent dehydrogenase (short-subunit alcohol dehydrogenase family)